MKLFEIKYKDDFKEEKLYVVAQGYDNAIKLANRWNILYISVIADSEVDNDSNNPYFNLIIEE